jgi:hypothetical protein
MDVRDVIQVEIPDPDPDILKTIWDLQKDLLEKYIKIEALLPYPLNLDVKKNQNLIKDFISRIVEELAESHEHYLEGREELEKEELADTLHFFMELLIYVYPDYPSLVKSIPVSIPNGHPINNLRKYNLGAEYTDMVSALWYTVYHLNLARNALRNKPWKQTEVVTNKDLFYYHLMLALSIFFSSVWTDSPKKIYEFYYRKNIVNHFRIQSKY